MMDVLFLRCVQTQEDNYSKELQAHFRWKRRVAEDKERAYLKAIA